MTTQPIFRAAALAALALLATFAASAQGLGGMLNKAKAKVNQATSAGASPSRAATAGANPSEMTPATIEAAQQNYPQDPSIEEMQEYARTLMADPRPAGRDCRDRNCPYRRLTIDQSHPIKFTWDQAAMVKFKKHYTDLWSFIDDFSGNIGTTLTNDGSIFHVPVSKVVHKVKEIHITSKPNLEDTGKPGEEVGWWFSFNPATGVLTASMSTNGIGPNSLTMSRSGTLSAWITRYVK